MTTLLRRRYCATCFGWVRVLDYCWRHPTAGLIDRVTMLLRRAARQEVA